MTTTRTRWQRFLDWVFNDPAPVAVAEHIGQADWQRPGGVDLPASKDMPTFPRTKGGVLAELEAQAVASRNFARGYAEGSARGAEYVGEARAYRDAYRIVAEIKEL